MFKLHLVIAGRMPLLKTECRVRHKKRFKGKPAFARVLTLKLLKTFFGLRLFKKSFAGTPIQPPIVHHQVCILKTTSALPLFRIFL
jgi:hypothetical protein